MADTKTGPPPSSGSLALLYLRLAIAGLSRAIISPFKGSNGAPVYFRDVMYAVVRAQLRNMTIAQSRQINKPTSQVYIDWIESKNRTVVTEDLENGAKAHWLGDKSAEEVIVYYHGGGYTQPLQPAYFDYLDGFVDLLNASGRSVAVVVLAYTLVPEAIYPTQLAQASTLLNHLLKTRSASSITLMGDSAGGNITLGVLSHILHPHSNAQVPRIKLSEPLKGIAILSPWVSFEEQPSYQRNAETDVLEPSALKRWSDLLIGKGNLHDQYTQPISAGVNWWKEASKSVSNVLIWGGGDEILIDSIKAFGDDFGAGWTKGGGSTEKVEITITPKNAHVEPVLDAMLQYKTKGEGALVVENWLKKV